MKTITINPETKIEPDTTDEMCSVCSQNYEGDCVAFCHPHSEKERSVRMNGYGMECEKPDRKVLLRSRGVKYHTMGD